MSQGAVVRCLKPIARDVLLLISYEHDGWCFGGWRPLAQRDGLRLPVLTHEQQARRFASDVEAVQFFREVYRHSLALGDA